MPSFDSSPETNRIVAFIDILGFKKQYETRKEQLLSALEELNHFENTFAQMNSTFYELTGEEHLQDLGSLTRKVSRFSDSIVYSYQADKADSVS